MAAAGAAAGGTGSCPFPAGSPALTASGDRLNDHAPRRLDALGLTGESGLGDDVVDDLALEGVHGLEAHRLAGPADLGHGTGRNVLQGAPTVGAITRDVEHQAAALTRPSLHRQPRQLLQRLEHLTVPADEAAQLTIPAALGQDRDGGTPVLDVDVDVAVQIDDVEELLEVVRRDLALLLQPLQRRPALRPLGLVVLGRVLRLVVGSCGRDPSALLLLLVLVRRWIHLGHDVPLHDVVTPPPNVGVTEWSTPRASTTVTRPRAALAGPLRGRRGGGARTAASLGPVLPLRL